MLRPQSRLPSRVPNIENAARLLCDGREAARGANDLSAAFTVGAIDFRHPHRRVIERLPQLPLAQPWD